MRRLPCRTGVSVAALLLGACSSTATPAPERTRLRVFVQPFLSSAPLLLAEAEGYYAEQNLEVEFVRLNDAAAAIPMLLNGTIDVLPGGPSPGVLNAMARGLPVRAVANKGYYRRGGCSRGGIVIRKDLLAATGRAGQPRIRRISIDRQPQMQYTVERMLASKGYRLRDLEVLYIPHLPEMEALADGSLDAALSGDPWLTPTLERGIAELWIRFEDVLPDTEFSFLYFGPSLLEGNPDAGRRFLVAYLRAVRQFEEGKTQRNLEILARVTEENAEALPRMCWPAFHTEGVNLAGVMDFQAWAIERKFIDRAATIEEFWEPSFLESANQVLLEERVK
jgi:ABC-type nitrate/sulfonate/bicarbonate transport system substrate-binding protein